jgi:hypothetical protein
LKREPIVKPRFRLRQTIVLISHGIEITARQRRWSFGVLAHGAECIDRAGRIAFRSPYTSHFCESALCFELLQTLVKISGARGEAGIIDDLATGR